MQPAPLSLRSDEFVTRRVTRDGVLVAVLRTLEHGGAFAVVAELAGDDDSSCVRPYTFECRDDAAAFLAEVVESFTYLGCEIQPA
jgi:hypothetical protein